MYSRVWVGAVAPRLTKGQEVLGDRWGPASCNLQREPVQWMSVVAVSNGLDLLARETLTNQEKVSNCSGEACGKNEQRKLEKQEQTAERVIHVRGIIYTRLRTRARLRL